MGDAGGPAARRARDARVRRARCGASVSTPRSAGGSRGRALALEEAALRRAHAPESRSARSRAIASSTSACGHQPEDRDAVADARVEVRAAGGASRRRGSRRGSRAGSDGLDPLRAEVAGELGHRHRRLAEGREVVAHEPEAHRSARRGRTGARRRGGARRGAARAGPAARSGQWWSLRIGHRGVERAVGERQRLGGRLHGGRRADRALGEHHGRRLDGDDVAVGAARSCRRPRRR